MISFAAEKTSYKMLGEGQFESGFMASPAAVGKALFLRTKTHLYRVESAH